MELASFLAPFKCARGHEHATHTSIQSVFNDFEMSNQDTDYMVRDEVEFMRLYKQLAVNPDLSFHIHEFFRPEGGPLVLDLDYKLENKHAKRPKSSVTDAVRSVNQILKETFGLPEECIIAYVCEKDRLDKSGPSLKDGVHIFYPGVVLSLKERYFALDLAVKRCPSLKVNLDFRVLKNGIIMYKSTKRLWSPGYTLTSIFDYAMTESQPHFNDDAQIVDLLSIRNSPAAKCAPKKKIDAQYLDNVFKCYNPVQGQVNAG